MVRAWFGQVGKKWSQGARKTRDTSRAGRLGVEALEAREVMTAGLLPAHPLAGPGGVQPHALVTANDTPDLPAAPLPGGAAVAVPGPLSLPSAFDRAFPSQLAGTPKLDLSGAARGEGFPDLAKRLFGARPDPAQTLAAATDAGVNGPKLAELFQDADRYHGLLTQVFGEGYDRAEADRLREQALKGDFSFLPKVRFLDRATLLGHHAAYNGQEGVVYLAEDLEGNKPLLQAAYLEELGHHLDRRLNRADTRGDEGELFRRLASGETLSSRQLARVRAENDARVIMVDGRPVKVEFFFNDIVNAVGNAVSGAVDAVGDAANAVGNAVGDAADAVGQAASDAANAVGNAANAAANAAAAAASAAAAAAANAAGHVVNAVVAVGEGYINAFNIVGQAVVNDLGRGVFGNLAQGNISGAFQAAVNGVSNIVFDAPTAIANGGITAAEELLKAPTHFLGDTVGGVARDVISRGGDIARTVNNAVSQISENFARKPFEAAGAVIDGIGAAAGEALKGNFGEASRQLGGGILNAAGRVVGTVVDSFFIGVQAGATVIGDLGLHAPSRALNAAEKALLKRVYGGSLNVDVLRLHIDDISTQVGIAAHALGNEIYIPSVNSVGTVNVDSSGNLTPAGLQLLVHEAAHTWQSQNHGNGYISASLAAQAGAALGGGDRNGAYNHHPEIIAGTAFEKLNPEQQAEVIEDIGQVLLANPNLTFDSLRDPAVRAASKALFEAVINPERAELGLTSLTDAEYTRLLGFWAHVRSGGRVPSATATAELALTAAGSSTTGQALMAGKKPAAAATPVKAATSAALASATPLKALAPVVSTPQAKPVVVATPVKAVTPTVNVSAAVVKPAVTAATPAKAAVVSAPAAKTAEAKVVAAAAAPLKAATPVVATPAKAVATPAVATPATPAAAVVQAAKPVAAPAPRPVASVAVVGPTIAFTKKK